MNRAHHERGIGLIEVMIALAITLFTALAVNKMQTSGIISASVSSLHLSADELSSNMLEILRSHRAEAASGAFNFDGSDETSVSQSEQVKAWVRRIENEIPKGKGSINCTSIACELSISWVEEVDGSNSRQFYRSWTPL